MPGLVSTRDRKELRDMVPAREPVRLRRHLHGRGGYAVAKATIRFIASYAADESERNGLGIRFVSVLPQLTPATDLGAAAIAAYAARSGLDVADFLAPRGPVLTAEQAGQAVLGIAADASIHDGAYLLSAAGLKELP